MAIMRKKRVNFDEVRPIILADWRTGAYTVRDLAYKHGVSAAFVNGITKGVACDTKTTVNNIIALEQDLARLDRRSVNSVHEVALDLIHFERANSQRMETATLKAMDMLPNSERVSDVKSVMDVLKIHREAILGKSPDTAIQINNSPEPEYESKYLKQRQARFIRE